MSNGAALLKAVKKATRMRLESTILSLYQAGGTTQKLVEELLLANASKSKKRPSTEQQPAVSKRARYAECIHCLEECDTLKNGQTECIYHAGELIPDETSAAWADHDDAFGPMEGFFEDGPENFYWDCCEGSYDSKGCLHASHTSKKFAGMTEPQPIGDASDSDEDDDA